jgi:hypothetical protein
MMSLYITRTQSKRCTFLILYLLLDILDGVSGFHLQSDGLASECFHKNLHRKRTTKGLCLFSHARVPK